MVHNQNILEGLLRQYFGHKVFRDGQLDIIEALISGKDILGVMPTGAGKSMCYQIPALALDGITLVVSPLISLMKDQVAALVDAGVSAAYLNSSLTAAQYREALRRASLGAYKIIYIAPERLLTDDFLSFAQGADISLLAVDEAHCVSHWGQDFRPSYLKISEFIKVLPKKPPVAALTATATADVRQDIVAGLNLEYPFVTVTGFDRQNLYFSVAEPKDKYAELLTILQSQGDKSGIIYCSTRKTVEEVYSNLSSDGYSVARYHAGLKDYERHESQDDFIYDRKQIIVATNAFGMGIDKSNVSFVVHYNMPKNIESYYQEAGRAGRDGEPAQCILLYSGQDVRTCRFFIDNPDDNSELSDEQKQLIYKKDLDRLKSMTIYSTTSDCLRQFILRYFGEMADGFCGSCGNCDTKFEELDMTVEAQKILSCVARFKQVNRSFGRTMLADVLHGSQGEKVKSFGLDKLSTYGILSGVTSKRIFKMIDVLIEYGYLQQSGGEYPTLQLTEKSDDILRRGHTLTMKLPKEIEDRKTAKADKRTAKNRTISGEINEKLLSELKTLRTKLASEANMPSYIVFSNATLHDMCVKLPRAPNALLSVSGVGSRKAEKYGELFLDVIRKHVEYGMSASEAEYDAKPAPSNKRANDTMPAPTNKQGATDSPLYSHKRWTEQEDLLLQNEYENGDTLVEMTVSHLRTETAILSRLKKFELIHMYNDYLI